MSGQLMRFLIQFGCCYFCRAYYIIEMIANARENVDL